MHTLRFLFPFVQQIRNMQNKKRKKSLKKECKSSKYALHILHIVKGSLLLTDSAFHFPTASLQCVREKA